MYPQKYFGMSHGVVTVRHPGDPLYPAVIVTEPGAVAPPVADVGASVGGHRRRPAHRARLGKSRDEAGDLVELATDVPMAPSATWRGCYLWNL